jgi:transposase InsO family protein
MRVVELVTRNGSISGIATRTKPTWVSIPRLGSTHHIQPAKPMQNSRVESFNGRLRDECLNASWFLNLADAKRKIESWREEYNAERPHSSLGSVQ